MLAHGEIKLSGDHTLAEKLEEGYEGIGGMSGFSEWLADVKDVRAPEALAIGLPTKRVDHGNITSRGLARTTWQPASPQTTEQFAVGRSVCQYPHGRRIRSIR